MTVAIGPARLHVLGGFGLDVGSRPAELPLQAQRVLAYLAVVQPSQARHVLAGSLWGEMTQRASMACLRNALWRLRAASPALVDAGRDTVRLHPEVTTDIGTSRSCAAHLARAPLDEADSGSLALFEADVLPGWDDEWLLIERERQRQLRIHALEQLARGLARRGCHAQAIQAALCAVGAEPLRESAQSALIEAHLAEGNASEALRQYRQFSALLAGELGLRPSARLRDLLRGLLPPPPEQRSAGRQPSPR